MNVKQVIEEKTERTTKPLQGFCIATEGAVPRSGSYRDEKVLVIKAGGSIFPDLNGYLNLAKYVSTMKQRGGYQKIIIVPSAMQNVTNILKNGFDSKDKTIQTLRQKYEPILDCVGDEYRKKVEENLPEKLDFPINGIWIRLKVFN